MAQQCIVDSQAVQEHQIKMGREKIAAGVTLSNTLFEIWASDNEWFALVIVPASEQYPSGGACLMGRGTVWQQYPRGKRS